MNQKTIYFSILVMISIFFCSYILNNMSSDLLNMQTCMAKEINSTKNSMKQEEIKKTSDFHFPTAKGLIVYGGNPESNMVTIDASDIERGYIMVKCDNGSDANKKIILQGPTGLKYTYDLNAEGKYEVFVLSEGDGQYVVTVYENIEGSKYSILFGQQIDVTLENPFIPFLNPNQYVNYKEDSQVVKLAEKLTVGLQNDIEKVETVYHYVVDHITYDKQKAQTVQSGYLPDIDEVLRNENGICFDYAAVMTAMLRSQDIPTKLVTGFTGNTYHAWISTYIAEFGWVEGVIFFDGTTWKLMDPTLAAAVTSEKKNDRYLIRNRNYIEKYIY